MKRRQLLVLLSLGLGVVMALGLLSLTGWAAPGNPLTEPLPNSHTVSPTTSIAITYDEPINPSTVSTATFAVHALQTGLLTQTYSVEGGTVRLTPIQPLQAGELVQVSATTGTLSLVDGLGPAAPTVWGFRVAAGVAEGTFADTGQRLGRSSSFDVALGDLDGDGDLDAFVANYNQPLGTGLGNRVWLNDGSGWFTDSGQSLGEWKSVAVALGDLDRDGDLDAFVANENQGNRVWRNEGGAVFTDTLQSLGVGMSNDLALGDLDGDGDLDAVVATGGDTNRVWWNDGLGGFTENGLGPGEGSSAVALGDLDGDGDLDAFLGQDPNGDEVWLNGGLGVFTNSGQSLGTFRTSAVALGDLDGDGDLDVYAANGQPDKVWLNDGNGLFSDSGQSLSTLNSTEVALGDVDGDGDLDALVARWDQWNELWLNSDGTFTLSDQQIDPSYSHGVALGDLDGDTDLDAFVANDSQQPNTVWLNRPRWFLFLPVVVRSGGTQLAGLH